MRMIRQTDYLPVTDQIAIYVVPPVLGRYLHERELGGLGILRMDQAHQIGDAMDMRIHTY